MQDQETLTQALVAEKEWLATLTQKITEVQGTLQQAKQEQPSQQNPAPALPVSAPLATPAAESAPQSPASVRQSAPQPQQEPADGAEAATEAAPVPIEYQSYVTGAAAAYDDDSSSFTLPISAADAKVEAPARLQLALGAELADDDHYLVHEQQHRQHRYTSSDIDFSPASPKISLAFGAQPNSKRSTRTTRDDDSSWTLLSHNARAEAGGKAVPLGDAPVGTLAGDATALMKGVYAAGSGSLFLTEGPKAQPGSDPSYRVYRRTSDAEVGQPLAAKQAVKQALYGQ